MIMKILPALLFFLLATLVSAIQASDDALSHQIHLPRPQTGSRGSHVPGISCLSWRLGVETHNIIDWETVPAACEGYVGHYMLGKDDKNLWIFDIDETSLSNLPYYVHHGFGVEAYDSTTFDAWVLEGTAPALPESLKLYKKLLTLGVKVAFHNGKRRISKKCHRNQSQEGWISHLGEACAEDSSYSGKTAVVYKSSERKKFEENGYIVIGNIGDQWSDLLRTNVGNRTFKMPDPMYYIS